MELTNIRFAWDGPVDWPELTNAVIEYAEHEDGTPLSEDELAQLDAGEYYEDIVRTLI